MKASKNRHHSPTHILITGASSGLGAALAREYAAAPETKILSLSGRNKDRLENTAKACQRSGLAIHTQTIDVRNQTAVKDYIEARDQTMPVDLVIANAGISGGTAGAEDLYESPDQAAAIWQTNMDGALHTIWPLIPRMKKRGYGQIALMSSLSAFAGWPGAPSYSASKAALRVYGEALEPTLRDHGINVSVICPGFIKTPLTDVNNFPMPMLLDADKAANIIHRGLRKGRPRIAFPLPVYFCAAFLGVLPYIGRRWLLKAMPTKKAQKFK